MTQQAMKVYETAHIKVTSNIS